MKYDLQFQVSFMVWNTVDYKEHTVHDFFTYGFICKDEKKNYMEPPNQSLSMKQLAFFLNIWFH